MAAAAIADVASARDNMKTLFRLASVHRPKRDFTFVIKKKTYDTYEAKGCQGMREMITLRKTRTMNKDCLSIRCATAPENYIQLPPFVHTAIVVVVTASFKILSFG